MLILDNVDDASFLVQPQTGQANGVYGQSIRPLSTYLPPSRNGSIHITTRNRGMTLKLVAQGDIVDVQPMDKPDAVTLLERKLGLESKGEDIGKLAESLEFIPIAIVQAAAYIRERAPRCSVEQYIEKFHKSDRAMISLLDYEAGQLRRDTDAKNSMTMT